MIHFIKAVALLSCLLWGLLICTNIAAQAEEPEATTAAPKQAAPEDASETEEPTAQQTAAEPQEDEQKSAATLERFTPSEEISADRSVAFPNDI